MLPSVPGGDWVAIHVPHDALESLVCFHINRKFHCSPTQPNPMSPSLKPSRVISKTYSSPTVIHIAQHFEHLNDESLTRVLRLSR